MARRTWVFARPLVESGRLRLVTLDGRRPDRDRERDSLTGPLPLIFPRWEVERMTPFFDFLYGKPGREIVARDLLPVSAVEAGYRGASTFARA